MSSQEQHHFTYPPGEKGGVSPPTLQGSDLSGNLTTISLPQGDAALHLIFLQLGDVKLQLQMTNERLRQIEHQSGQRQHSIDQMEKKLQDLQEQVEKLREQVVLGTLASATGSLKFWHVIAAGGVLVLWTISMASDVISRIVGWIK